MGNFLVCTRISALKGHVLIIDISPGTFVGILLWKNPTWISPGEVSVVRYAKYVAAEMEDGRVRRQQRRDAVIRPSPHCRVLYHGLGKLQSCEAWREREN